MTDAQLLSSLSRWLARLPEHSMILGFTGSQFGLTDGQLLRIAALIDLLKPTQIHHGDCVGADEQVDKLAAERDIWRGIHPPSNPVKRAFCHRRMGSFELYPPKGYLDRNRDIVNLCSVIIAGPRGVAEERRSGTWSTVRFARTRKRSIYIVNPKETRYEARGSEPIPPRKAIDILIIDDPYAVTAKIREHAKALQDGTHSEFCPCNDIDISGMADHSEDDE